MPKYMRPPQLGPLMFERWELMGLQGLPFPDPCTENRSRRVRALDDYLRLSGLPYVVVTEAKKAIFAPADLEKFDFLVYSRSGPNLLVLLLDECRASPTPEQAALMREWERMFGDGFAAVFVSFNVLHQEWWGVGLAKPRLPLPLVELTA